MAEVGNHPATPSTSYSEELNAFPQSISITMPAGGGTATSIWFWGDTVAARTYYAAIYDGAGAGSNLIDQESSGVTPGAQTGAWTEIPLTGASLTGSATYILAVGPGSNTSGQLYHNGAESNIGFSNFYISPSAWPSTVPANAFDDGGELGRYIYLEYAESGGGGVIPGGLQHLSRGFSGHVIARIGGHRE